MNSRHLSSVLVAWSVLACLSACRHSLDSGATRNGVYEEWLSMSPSTRQNYVEGFTDGYAMGSIAACNNADRLFQTMSTKSAAFDNAGNLQMPTPRCLEALDHYTRLSPDHMWPYGIYAGAITEFYNKYPKYRRVPFSYLLRFLSDKQYGSADQLYQAFERKEIQGTF